MKKVLLLFFACIFACYASAENGKHVVLVTIDGFRPDFYLESTWHTPHLKEMMKEGSYALGVNSVLPSMTYPSHTTIVTGVQPAEHGIFYNGMFEPDTITGKIYWNFHQIEAPTLWQTVDRAGMTAASLNWPVSAEAPVVFNIPDISGRKKLIEKYSVPEGILDTLNDEIFHSDGFINLGKDQNSAQIAAWAIEKYKPNFMTIHLFSVDHAEHMSGRSGKLVEDAVSDADESIGIIREALRKAGIEGNTLLIVTGDHGFEDVHTYVQPNVWLAKAGLLENPEGKWKARFNSVGGSSYLYLRDKNDKETLDEVKRILSSLPSGTKKFIRIVTPEEAKKIGANPETPIILSGLNGAAFGNEYKGKDIEPGHGGNHGYYPDTQEIRTGFICVAKGVRKGGKIKEMNERDLTAIVLKYLGLQMPTCKGKIPAKLFIR